MRKKEISPKNGLRLILGGLSGLLVTMQATVMLRGGQSSGHGWMAYPGFFLAFGILGACLLAVAAKLIIFPLLKRPENYYEETSP